MRVRFLNLRMPKSTDDAYRDLLKASDNDE
jgi:hypothetical protein